MDASASGGQAIGSTLSSGVQDISALLPLLGTEQCEDHVASGLTKGYFYVAASPISLFGSLGVARTGFKTFMAALFVPSLRLEGAKLLADAGFKPQGVNVPLIMIDDNEEQESRGSEKRKYSTIPEQGCYRAEKSIVSMMEGLHIDDSNRITVSSMSRRWNTVMTIYTAIACVISVTPYIHLNLHEPNALNHFVRWAFPVMRALGGFLTATMIQFVIQMRLLVIVRKRLILMGQEKELKRLGIDIDGKASPWVQYPSVDQRCSLLERHVKQQLASLGTPSTLDHIYRRSSLLGPLLRRVFGPSANRSPADTTSPLKDPENPGDPNAQTVLNELDSEDNVRPTRVELLNLQSRITKANGNPFLMSTILTLLLVGVVASVAGYVGCFSAVQGSASSKDALIWLGLEISLSIVRVILWGINPKHDDAPPLRWDYELDKYPPFPTCTLTAEEIEEQNNLPLVRAPEFLQSITSYAGLLKQFSNPALSLYYTFTWRCLDVPSGKPGERALYITIYDHTERTTRVCADNRLLSHSNGDGAGSTVPESDKDPANSTLLFYSAEPITVDLEHGVLKTKLGPPVGDDPIATNDALRSALIDHYHSILGQVNSRLCNDPRTDTFEDDWSLKFGDTKNQMQKRGGTSNGSDAVVWERDHEYLKRGQELGRLENTLRDLFRIRGQWVEDYMTWLSEDMDRNFSIVKEVHRTKLSTNGWQWWDGMQARVEELLVAERYQMEQMLVNEILRWEKKLRSHLEDVIRHHFPDGPEKGAGANLTRRWKGYLWERLGEAREGILARMKSVKRVAKNKSNIFIDSFWASLQEIDHRDLFEQLTSIPPSLPDSPPASYPWVDEWMEGPLSGNMPLCDWFKARYQGMKRRLASEARDVEARLELGFEYCDEFWSDPNLPHLIHSESRWQVILDTTDITFSALKRNQYATHIGAYQLSVDDISRLCNTEQCTSIFCRGAMMLSDFQFPQSLLSISSLDSALSLEQVKMLEQNRSRVDETRRTTFEFSNMVVYPDSWIKAEFEIPGTFTVRFFGPPTELLRLQLTHRSYGSATNMTIQMNDSPPLDVSVAPSTSLKEFVLCPETKSDTNSEFTFRSNSRNTLTCSVVLGYALFNIELVDEQGQPFRPDSQCDKTEGLRSLDAS